jgi:hypothetical protein
MLARPERTGGERTYECNDTTPVDYTRGPHDDELDLDDRDDAAPADFIIAQAHGEVPEELEPLDASDHDYNDDF